MAFPPSSINATKSDTTVTATDHAAHHNALANAVNETVSEVQTWTVDRNGGGNDLANVATITLGGTTPQASAAIDLQATSKALLVNRLTTTQRDALTAANGMVIYNTTLAKFQFYGNGSWQTIAQTGDIPSVFVTGLSTTSSAPVASANASAIQAALDAVSALGGGVVVLPTSTEDAPFETDATIWVAPQCALIGQGQDRTWIKQRNGSNLDAVIATTYWKETWGTDDGAGQKHTLIAQLSVDYNWKDRTGAGTVRNTSTNHGHGVVIGAPYRAGVEKVTIRRPYGHGIYFDSATRSRATLSANISSTTATSYSVSDATAFPSTGPFVIRIDSEDIKIDGGYGTTTLTSSSSANRGYHSSTAATHTSGTVVYGYSGESIEMWIRNCRVEYPGLSGIQSENNGASSSGTDGWLQDSVIVAPNQRDVNNTGDNANYGHGVYLSQAGGWVISGCHLYGNYTPTGNWVAMTGNRIKDGMRLFSANGLRCIGNKIADFGYCSTHTTYYGINARPLNTGARPCLVVANEVTTDEDDAANTYYGIRINVTSNGEAQISVNSNHVSSRATTPALIGYRLGASNSTTATMSGTMSGNAASRVATIFATTGPDHASFASVRMSGNSWQWVSASPTTQGWPVGTVVTHSAPSTGNPMGWICTATGLSGSNDTWKALANVA